jgi:hypothetical protein
VLKHAVEVLGGHSLAVPIQNSSEQQADRFLSELIINVFALCFAPYTDSFLLSFLKS